MFNQSPHTSNLPGSFFVASFFPPPGDEKTNQFLLKNDAQLKHLKLNDLNSAYFMSTRPDGTPCEFLTPPWHKVVPWRPPEFELEQVCLSFFLSFPLPVLACS